MSGNNDEYHTVIIQIKMLHQTVKNHFWILNSVLAELKKKQLWFNLRTHWETIRMNTNLEILWYFVIQSEHGIQAWKRHPHHLIQEYGVDVLKCRATPNVKSERWVRILVGFVKFTYAKITWGKLWIHHLASFMG